ncbi:MAG: LysR family transcriptional regulator substrate-binding protein [Eggerthellaceae bacterium]
MDAYDRAQAAIATVVKERPIRVDGILYDNTVSSIISLSTVLLNDQRHVPILFDHHEGRPLFEQLEQDEVDMVFAYDEARALEERGLVFRPLVQTPFVAVVDQDHPLAKHSEISIDDLSDETFIQFIDEYSVSGWRRIEQICREHGFEPKKRPKLGRARQATQPPRPTEACPSCRRISGSSNSRRREPNREHPLHGRRRTSLSTASTNERTKSALGR